MNLGWNWTTPGAVCGLSSPQVFSSGLSRGPIVQRFRTVWYDMTLLRQFFYQLPRFAEKWVLGTRRNGVRGPASPRMMLSCVFSLYSQTDPDDLAALNRGLKVLVSAACGHGIGVVP